jgi:hypothetical protein
VTLEAASRAIQKLDLTPHQCEVLLDLQSSLQENKYAVCVCACVCVWCVWCVCIVAVELLRVPLLLPLT